MEKFKYSGNEIFKAIFCGFGLGIIILLGFFPPVFFSEMEIGENVSYEFISFIIFIYIVISFILIGSILSGGVYEDSCKIKRNKEVIKRNKKVIELNKLLEKQKSIGQLSFPEVDILEGQLSFADEVLNKKIK